MGKPARRSVANNPSTPYDTYIVQPKSKVGVAPETTTSKIQTSTPGNYYSEAAINATSSSPNNGTYHGQNATNASTSTTSSYSNKTPEQLAAERAAAERERQREEFYATYDVMTGVRIAATLGCFFAFMVFLIAYKSRNKDDGLSDPEVAATTATLVQEEEEREEQEVWEATQRAIYEAELDLDLDTCENRSRKRPRMLSLGNLNVPPTGRFDPNLRFSSVGGGYGYNGLLKPQFRRFSAASFVSDRYRRGSVGPLRKRSSSMESPRVSSASYRMQPINSGDNKVYRRHKSGSDSDGDEADDEFEQITVTADINHQPSSFLSVPKGQDSRRSSGLTCCSTESSFLERRCSAMSLGITSLPAVSRRSSFRDDIDIEAGHVPAQTIVQQRPHTAHATTHIHPEIEIIKATPRTSPNLSTSERQSMQQMQMMELKPILQRRATISVASDDKGFDYIAEYPDEVVVEIPQDEIQKRQQQQHQSETSKIEVSGRAPLASLSSFKLSSADCNDSIELQSLGSDTVFDDYYADTEDDMDPLTTDSDDLSEEGRVKRKTVEPSPRKSILKNPAVVTTTTTTATSSATATDSNNKCTCDSITISHAGSSGGTTGSGITTNEIIIVSDGKGNQIGILPRFSSNSISIINTETFETKAIIERHEPENSLTTGDATTPTSTTKALPFTTVKFPAMSTSNPDPCGGSDTNLQKHRAKKLKKIQEEQERKRPASTMMNYSLSTLQKKLWGGRKSNNKHKDPESDNSNDKSSKLSKTKGNNKKLSKPDDASSHSSNDTPGDGTDVNDRQITARCVDSSIIVRDLSPVVVLELPILAAQGETKEREEERQEQELASNVTLDPEAPSTSRKWSRETLF